MSLPGLVSRTRMQLHESSAVPFEMKQFKFWVTSITLAVVLPCREYSAHQQEELCCYL
jgi:hypothetical protein